MNLKDDPISLVLLGAAGLLAVMYTYEQHGLRELGLAEDRALAIDMTDLTDCRSHAAEFDGQVLAVKCTIGEANELAETLQPRAKSNGFIAVAIAVNDEVLRCPVDGAVPDACQLTHPTPRNEKRRSSAP